MKKSLLKCFQWLKRSKTYNNQSSENMEYLLNEVEPNRYINMYNVENENDSAENDFATKYKRYLVLISGLMESGILREDDYSSIIEIKLNILYGIIFDHKKFDF